MIIKNRQSLATTEQRRQALEIAEAGIERVLPDNIVPAAVTFDKKTRRLTVGGDEYDVSHGRIFVIGGGKASGLMARSIETILGIENITAGVVSVKSDAGPGNSRPIEIKAAGHPVPDERGVEAVNRMLALKEEHSIGAEDLVICLISGGGSALMPSPAAGITLADKQAVTGRLLGSGADITEINTVRKHLSATKGGRLGRRFSPARVVSLILSDVIGNDLSVIASGPTYPDATTFSQALAVLEKYGLSADVPPAVVSHLHQGADGLVEETPEKLENCRNYIIGDSSLALEAMHRKALELGLKPLVITATQAGDTTQAAADRAAEIIGGEYQGYNALLLGGETTPTLPARPGRGGRNQHYAAVSLQALASLETDWTLASVGTDGSDFLPDTAGAIVDRQAALTAAEKKLDLAVYLERFDSHTLLRNIGGCLIETGDTGTNVGDVIVYLVP